MPAKSPSIFDNVRTFEDLFLVAHEAMTALRVLSADVPALPTDEIIERGLLFAKVSPTDQEIGEAMLYYRYVELRDKVATESHRLDPLVPALMWGQSMEQREHFRTRLKELMRSPAKARLKHMATDMKLLRNQLLIIGDLDDHGAGSCRFYPMTFEAGFTFVLLALYNKDQKRWKRLKKCGHCRSIFIRKLSEIGGRPRDYCTPECQRNKDQKRALVRQRNARKRMSK